ncbi:MAG: futalosine hydrolase [Bacteroidota bacterium]|nr:futalosine hydrolase [Bacteroidota bacterium]MDP4211980.1 futalosine hydrolase [Bacteroidota bacterium]
MRILLISATPPELRQTAEWLEAATHESREVARPQHDSLPLQTEQLITGVGQLQTAYCLLKKICTHRPDFVIQAGIGGSTDAKHIGQVFGIHSDSLADLGVKEKAGFKSIFDLSLGNPEHFPFSDGSLKNPYTHLMAWSGFSFLEGITVNEISTTRSRIQALKQKSSCFVESMEGAALHYVCLMEKIPFLQIRSVSNVLGERDKSRWKLSESLTNLNVALIRFIKKLQTTDETIFRF